MLVRQEQRLRRLGSILTTSNIGGYELATPEFKETYISSAALRTDTDQVLYWKPAAVPSALTPHFQLRRKDLKTGSPFDSGAIKPPSLSAEAIPNWSPFRPSSAIPRAFDMLFPRAYFESVRVAPPSPTMIRHLNEKVSRLRKRGLTPEWMPDQKFTPADMPHLLALALAQGASGGLDLADVMSDMPKLLTKLGDSAFSAGEIMEKSEGSGVTKAIVLLAALTMVGLVPLGYSPFFTLIQDPDLNRKQSVVFLFNWISESLSEQTIKREALRAMHSDADSHNASAAVNFIYPQIRNIIEETQGTWDAAVKEVFGETLHKAIGAGLPRNTPIEEQPLLPQAVEVPPLPSEKWAPPETPDGVVLTGRAIRGIRRERRYAEDRLVDGLKVLGLYRSMRTGQICFEAYRNAVRQGHFEDAPCFADPASLIPKLSKRDSDGEIPESACV
jgi:hypothetical protein